MSKIRFYKKKKKIRKRSIDFRLFTNASIRNWIFKELAMFHFFTIEIALQFLTIFLKLFPLVKNQLCFNQNALYFYQYIYLKKCLQKLLLKFHLFDINSKIKKAFCFHLNFSDWQSFMKFNDIYFYFLLYT